MKTLDFMTAMALIVACLLALGNSSGANPQNTGAPGEATCGRFTCHNIPANIGPAIPSVFFGDSTTQGYRPGNTHLVTVSLMTPQSFRNGFQVVALDTNAQNAGSWILTDPEAMQIREGLTLTDRRYVTHTSNGNNRSSWQMNWMAPDSVIGPVSFYVAILDANNNGNNQGDRLYLDTLMVDHDPLSAVKESTRRPLVLFPNPATDYINIASLEIESKSYAIYDMYGRRVLTGRTTGMVSIDRLTSGAYFFKLSGAENLITRFLVL